MARLTKFDERMFEKAREVADTSNFDHFHLGCVITYKHHIISKAANSYKTHPVQKYYNQRFRNFRKGIRPCNHTVHAEIAALSSIPISLENQINWREVRVYMYRIAPGLPTGHGMARCCPACLAALRNKGIRHIYYTTDEGYVYERLEDEWEEIDA